MLNQIILVGRLIKNPEIIRENEKRKAVITLAIPRNYKNSEGIYETDFVDCILWNEVATNTTEYCKKGDLIGIKGRIQTKATEIDGQPKHIMEVVAEKVTFLASRKEESEEV